jgi:predicted phage terminase large subunit-like protein
MTSLDQLLRRATLLKRLAAANAARDDLLAYARLTMPDPRDLDDTNLTLYQTTKAHQVMADALMRLEARQTRRLILTCPPRHGKTTLATRALMAWHMGRHPEQHLMFGTYNDTFAEENGRAVRDLVLSPQHRQVFPDAALKPGSAAVTRLETVQGGVISFAGRGATFTGRGGHGLILDDPIKNDEEADSKLIRDKLWNWFIKTVTTRMMTEDAFILLVQTRWHEDDIIGRLLDPTNPYYNEDEAKDWTVLEMPAIAGDNDILGRKPGEVLWPERFGLHFLDTQRRRDPRAFEALYQGRPTPEGGTFFTADMIRTYVPGELPKDLRYYCASDHAVTLEQRHDKTCLLPVGVDRHDNIYILDDVWWQKAEADVTTEAMLALMKKYKPIYWWAERGHISKSIGPFLRKRMMEEHTFVSVVQVQPAADKQQRAQSIQGRMSMGRVYFPAHARWWPGAREQLIRFPNGANDDFVDALAYIGIGMMQQVGPGSDKLVRAISPGTFGWLKRESDKKRAGEKAKAQAEGW